jgi:hypothetical protein
LKSQAGNTIITGELIQIVEHFAEKSIFFKLLKENFSFKSKSKNKGINICETNYQLFSSVLLIKSFCTYTNGSQDLKQFTNLLENELLPWLESLKQDKSLGQLNFKLGSKQQAEYLSSVFFQSDNPIISLLEEEEIISTTQDIAQLFYEMIKVNEFSSDFKNNVDNRLEVYFEGGPKKKEKPHKTRFEQGVLIELKNYTNIEQIGHSYKGPLKGLAIIITAVVDCLNVT